MVALGDGDRLTLFRDAERLGAVIRHGTGDLAAGDIGRLAGQNFRRARGGVAGVRVKLAGAGDGRAVLAVRGKALEELVRDHGVLGEVHEDFAAREYDFAVVLIFSH